MSDLLVAPRTMERIRKFKEDYLKVFPGSPLAGMKTDRDILLFILFYGESKMIERMEKKKVFGIAAIPDPD